VSYPGSKGQAGVWQRIIGQMPVHSWYVEPFAGSAQIFFRKRLAAHNVLIDVDAGVISSLRVAAASVISDAHGRAAVDVANRDGIGWLQCAGEWRHDPTMLVYCDPPYLLETRRSRRYYKYEMSDDDHAALLSTLADLKCLVMISGYPSDLYSCKLQDWRCLSYRTRTRGRTVTECLWCNFPEPTTLHDWRYAGRNYRERLALNRLAARTVARLQAMPPRKQGFVLNAIEQRLDWRVAP
jgi:hypothetical protein